MKQKQILTTGDVASICRCSHDTVKRWLESGQLPGHRLPPQGQWRVLPKDLMEFMEEHGIPIDEEGRAVLPVTEPPVGDFVYCWEFHKHHKDHSIKEGEDCAECLVFRTKAKDCFVLRKQAEPGQVLCQVLCKDCDYYRYVTEMDMPTGGTEA